MFCSMVLYYPPPMQLPVIFFHKLTIELQWSLYLIYTGYMYRGECTLKCSFCRKIYGREITQMNQIHTLNPKYRMQKLNDFRVKRLTPKCASLLSVRAWILFYVGANSRVVCLVCYMYAVDIVFFCAVIASL